MANSKIMIVEERCEECNGTGTMYLGPSYDGPYYDKCNKCDGTGTVFKELKPKTRFQYINEK